MFIIVQKTVRPKQTVLPLQFNQTKLLSFFIYKALHILIRIVLSKLPALCAA